MGKLRSAIDALAAVDPAGLDDAALGELVVELSASATASTASVTAGRRA